MYKRNSSQLSHETNFHQTIERRKCRSKEKFAAIYGHRQKLPHTVSGERRREQEGDWLGGGKKGIVDTER